MFFNFNDFDNLNYFYNHDNMCKIIYVCIIILPQKLQTSKRNADFIIKLVLQKELY